MIKNNENLNKFIENFMSEFDPNNGLQLSNGFTPHHIVRAISGQFTDIKMEDEDLKDLVNIGFAIVNAATNCLEHFADANID